MPNENFNLPGPLFGILHFALSQMLNRIRHFLIFGPMVLSPWPLVPF